VTRPEILDDSWVNAEARTVEAGDQVMLDGDPRDELVNDATATVAKVEVFARKGKTQIRIHITDPTDFAPYEYLEVKLTDPLWIKRATR
jgi:hypothetical protein